MKGFVIIKVIIINKKVNNRNVIKIINSFKKV